MSRKTKIVYIILAAAIIAAIAFIAYAYTFGNNSSNEGTGSNKVNTSPPTREQLEAGEEAKRKTIENELDQKTPDDSDSTPQQLSVSFTAVNQNGAVVSIRSLIADIVSQSGTCTLTVTNGSNSTTKTAATQALANSSTCQGFDIQTSELGAGTWNIQLSVTIDGRSGSTNTTLEVQ